jgi:hypothetical protein
MIPLRAGIFGLDGLADTSDNPDTFYDTLDAMLGFWQNPNAPVEQMLTR